MATLGTDGSVRTVLWEVRRGIERRGPSCKRVVHLFGVLCYGSARFFIGVFPIVLVDLKSGTHPVD
jgi:hypothetical protein